MASRRRSTLPDASFGARLDRWCALQLAKPENDAAYFRSAKLVLCKLRHAGICHNDLSKQQNWLRGTDGKAYLMDFQLALVLPKRGPIFRIPAYEDLRHLLKHKRRYVPDALTASERRVLGRKSLVHPPLDDLRQAGLSRDNARPVSFPTAKAAAAGWSTTRPRSPQRIKATIRRSAMRQWSPFPIAAAASVSMPLSRAAISASTACAMRSKGGGNIAPPERLQLVDAFPRRASGEIRTEILQLVAMNQIDLIDPLIASETERGLVACIIAGRRNLRDRTAF